MSEEIQTDTPQPAPEAPDTAEVNIPAAPMEPVTPAEVAPAAEPVPEPAAEAAPAEAAPAVEAAAEATPPASTPTSTPAAGPRGDRPPREPRGDRPPREGRGDRPPRDREKQAQPQTQSNPNERAKAGNDRRGGPNDRPRDAGRGDRRPDLRRPDGPIEIEYDKLIGDSLYLDNQAHVLVARLRDLDAGTRSQLRRLYGAVRRACRSVEADRQHQFVMLRARLAYTIARHGLRSLDPLEKLLLQVTRRNETRGYDRFRDLFEAIIAYNE